MNREDLLLAVSIVLLVAFEAYSAIRGADPSRLVLSLPLISILIVFLLFLYTAAKAERRLNQSLERRLPEVQYLGRKKEVEIETTKLAEQAVEFIIATGGHSRNTEYLKILEHKAQSGDVSYWRLVFNDRITHEVCEHIRQVLSLPNVVIGQIEDRGYGNILVVDTRLIIALPVPAHGGLMGIKIPNSASAQRMFRYLMTVSSGAKRISSPQEVEALCETCSQSALGSQA